MRRRLSPLSGAVLNALDGSSGSIWSDEGSLSAHPVQPSSVGRVRARIVPLGAKGLQNKDIAAEVGLDRRQVALWRQRFLDGGIDALRQDAPRSGRSASVMDEMESRIVQATLHEKPAGATHWSTRTLAEHPGIGATTARRAWRNNGQKPQSQKA